MNAQLKAPFPRVHPLGPYGARALAAAREWRASGKAQREFREIIARYDVTKATLSFAGIVLEFAPELADQVETSKMDLRTAYTRARERRRGYAIGRGSREPLSLGERRAVWLLHALVSRARVNPMAAEYRVGGCPTCDCVRHRSEVTQFLAHAAADDDDRLAVWVCRLCGSEVNPMWTPF